MGFAPMEKAWLCPSRGAFSTPSSSALSPYLPPKERQPSQCLEYEIPLYPDAFGPTEENSVKAARAWLEEANGIQRLRQAGLWFADHDNVVMLTPYFRAQEHSAQLSSAELDKCTRQFREGDINGLVYKSKGITLNWHIPASAEAAAKLQNIRSRWKCRSCGSLCTAASRPP